MQQRNPPRSSAPVWPPFGRFCRPLFLSLPVKLPNKRSRICKRKARFMRMFKVYAPHRVMFPNPSSRFHYFRSPPPHQQNGEGHPTSQAGRGRDPAVGQPAAGPTPQYQGLRAVKGGQLTSFPPGIAAIFSGDWTHGSSKSPFFLTKNAHDIGLISKVRLFYFVYLFYFILFYSILSWWRYAPRCTLFSPFIEFLSTLPPKWDAYVDLVSEFDGRKLNLITKPMLHSRSKNVKNGKNGKKWHDESDLWKPLKNSHFKFDSLKESHVFFILSDAQVAEPLSAPSSFPFHSVPLSRGAFSPEGRLRVPFVQQMCPIGVATKLTAARRHTKGLCGKEGSTDTSMEDKV